MPATLNQSDSPDPLLHDVSSSSRQHIQSITDRDVLRSKALRRLSMLARVFHWKMDDPSTDAAGETAAKPPQRCIITTDIPDPDNFLMVLRVIKDHPGTRIDIVISPRPVDFAAIPYGDDFKTLMHSVGQAMGRTNKASSPSVLRQLISPMSETQNEEWMDKLSAKDRVWFYADAGLDDPDVRKDTQLYLQLSWLRMVCYLDGHGISRDRYSFFWDANFTTTQSVRPGCHHAAHKADFTYDFDDLLKARYKVVVAAAKCQEDSAHSQDLRRACREMCREFITTKKQALALTPAQQAQDLGNLQSDPSLASDDTILFIGGPFTEARTFIKDLGVRRAVAMGGFIDGSMNLFANQFNFMIDMPAARDVLRLAQRGQLDLTLLPTECVKGSAYALSRDEFDANIGDLSPATAALYAQWQPNAAYLHVFDMCAVMAHSVPDLYQVRNVDLQDLDEDVIRFTPRLESGESYEEQQRRRSSDHTGNSTRRSWRNKIKDSNKASTPNSTTGIKMFWAERTQTGTADDGTPVFGFERDPHMLAHRQLFLDELRATFTRP